MPDEVIVYDDGSTDNTYDIAKAAGADNVIRSPVNNGYGVAIRTLFQAARERNADVMVTIDSDGQHNPDQIPDVVKPIIEEGFDMVVGSRFLSLKDTQRVPRYRSLGIKTITKLAQSASYNNITDSQNGFRAYSKNALLKLNLFENGMPVSSEILLNAKQKNLSVKEVPITVSYDVEAVIVSKSCIAWRRISIYSNTVHFIASSVGIIWNTRYCFINNSCGIY